MTEAIRMLPKRRTLKQLEKVARKKILKPQRKKSAQCLSHTSARWNQSRFVRVTR
jgi:hypothetical protein